MNDWSVLLSNTAMTIFSTSRLPKKSLNQKLRLVQSMQVSTWLSNIAFHLLQIWQQTLDAINAKSCQSLPEILSTL